MATVKRNSLVIGLFVPCFCPSLPKIRSLQKALGVTSVVVTHDIQSTFKVGDRIAFLCDGGLCFVGSIEEARRSDEPRLRRFLTGGEEGGE